MTDNQYAGRQLLWAVQRVAAISGISIDRLQAHEVLEDLNIGQSPTEQVTALCRQFDWPQALKYPKLDPAQLPLVCYVAEHGWLLVVAQNADGSWVAHGPNGTVSLSSHATSDGFYFRFVFPAVGAIKQPARNLIASAFWDYKSLVLDGAFATLLINLIALVASFFSMQVYDRVIPTQGMETLGVLSLGVGMAIILEFSLKLARSRVMEYAVVGLDAQLSRSIFQRLLNVRLDQMPTSVGTLAGQLRAYEAIRAFLTASTVYLLIELPLSLLFVIIIGFLSSPAVLLIPLMFVIFSVTSGLILRRGIERQVRAGANLSNLKTGLLVEAVEGAETIKAGHGGWRFLSRWLDVNKRNIQTDLQVRKLSELGGYLNAVFQQLSYVALVAVGAWLVIEGRMTMGALIACTILSGRALSPLGLLPGFLVQYANARTALDGLENVFKLEVDNAGVERPLLPKSLYGNYFLKDVCYRYPGVGVAQGAQHMALHVAKLEIKAGDKVGVLGPVGSGKSTLLRLLSGMYQPQTGSVKLDGLELSQIARQRVSEQIGYLQQDHRLFAGTLRDNLLIGLPDPGEDAIHHAAQRTGLMQVISGHPKGLELPISEGGKGLSGGQRQLVAMTRLILMQPNIWLLDEPTASMDDELERRCLDALRESLSVEKTAIIVTHKPSILPLVTHLIVVSHHQVLLYGKRDEVLKGLQSVSKQA